MLVLSSVGTVYVKTAVAARVAGVDVDPTSDTVSLCLLAIGSIPGSSDWVAGSWETDSAGPTYYARLLVATPTPGRYTLWVKVVRSPETVVLAAGPVRVY